MYQCISTFLHSEINECTKFPGLCVNGRCKDTSDGFECDCKPGYAIDNFGTNCTGEW